MNISYELYRVFYYVASSLSFSEASKQLYISQSAVSQAIKTLEKKLGHPLFFRSTKKVSLTPEGELLLSHIAPAIRMIQAGEQMMIQETSLMGQLRIGASDTICRYFLIPYLQKFHQEYPQVRIRVTNQTSIGCASLLEKGQVDLIVSNWPNSRLNSGYSKYILKEFHDIFAANPECFPLKDQVLSLEQLLDYPILMLEQSSTTSEYLRQLFSSHSLNLVPEVELSSNDLLIDLARIGLGIAFIPDYVLPKDNPLFPIRLKQQLPPRQLVLACSSQIPLPLAASAFLEYFHIYR